MPYQPLITTLFALCFGSASLFAGTNTDECSSTRSLDEHLTVTIVDDRGEPIAGRGITVTRNVPPRSFQVQKYTTDAEGRIFIAARENWTGELSIRCKDRELHGHTEFDALHAWDGRPGTLELVQPRVGHLRGEIIGPGPFASLRCSIEGASFGFKARHLPGWKGPVPDFIDLQPNADGTFQLMSLSPGTYEMRIERGNSSDDRSITIRPGETTEVVRFQPVGPGRWVTGRVFDEYGEPLPNQRVEMMFDPDMVLGLSFLIRAKCITDSDGRYRFGPSPPGPVKIEWLSSAKRTATTIDRVLTSTDGVLSDQRDLTLNLDHPGRPYEHNIRVRFADEPCAGFDVHFENDQANGRPHRTEARRTDRQGDVSLTLYGAASRECRVSGGTARTKIAPFVICVPPPTAPEIGHIEVDLPLGSIEIVELPQDFTSGAWSATLFNCAEGQIPEQVAEWSREGNVRPARPPRCIGMCGGRYVLIVRNSRGSAEASIVLDGEETVRVQVPTPTCQLEVAAAKGSGAKPSAVQLARDGVVFTRLNALLPLLPLLAPPGSYDIYARFGPAIGVGRVVLREGETVTKRLDATEAGAATLVFTKGGSPMHVECTLRHALGFRFSETERPTSQEATGAEPSEFSGLPPGQFDVSARGRLVGTIDVAGGGRVETTFELAP